MLQQLDRDDKSRLVCSVFNSLGFQNTSMIFDLKYAVGVRMTTATIRQTTFQRVWLVRTIKIFVYPFIQSLEISLNHMQTRLDKYLLRSYAHFSDMPRYYLIKITFMTLFDIPFHFLFLPVKASQDFSDF